MTKEQLKVGMRIQWPRLGLIGNVQKITETHFMTKWFKEERKSFFGDCTDPIAYLNECNLFVKDHS